MVRKILVIISIAVLLGSTNGCLHTDITEDEKIEYFDQ